MRRGNNRGQVIVILVLGIFVLLGMAALAIDVGFIYAVRNELQRSADSGALAGASVFKETGQWSSDPNDPVSQLATSRAKLLASSDNVVRTPLDPDTEVAVSFPTNLRIRVDTQREVSLFFAGVLGIPKRTVTAYAVAEAYPASENLECVVPWGVPLPWKDVNGNGQYDDGVDGDPQWPPDDNVCLPYGVTDWSFETHSVNGPPSPRDDYLCQGSLQVLKIADPKAQLQPGNFFGMDFSGIVQECPPGAPTISPGANFYSYMIQHSCDCKFSVSTTDDIPIDTKTGNMVGPTIDPIAPNEYYGWTPAPGGYAWSPAQDSPYYYSMDPVTLKKTFISGNPDETSLMNGDPGAVWSTSYLNPGVDPGGGFPQSNNTSYNWYDNNSIAGGGDWWKSSRVLRVPIYDPTGKIDGGIHTPGSGKTSFEPLKFVGFWIQDIVYEPPNNGAIVGRFVTVGGWASGGDTATEIPGTPVLNIRLVE